MPQPSPEMTDLEACRALLKTGSRSFHTASLLLPARIHEPATALYAFCRVADDAIDAASSRVANKNASPDPARALVRLNARLDAIYQGRPHAAPPDRALAAVVHQHALPRTLLDSLLEGFAWDAEGRRYETLADLHAYAARVAGSVGAMMAVLMGARSPEAVARACDLGIAMQLSNIARDVGEDARMGRLYLPLAWLRDAGIDPAAFLANPALTPALAQVIDRLLGSAEALYTSAAPGVALLPWDCRPGIGTARLLYRKIGREVARHGHDSITRRATTTPRQKLALVALATCATPFPRRAPATPALAAAQHLVTAVATTPPRVPPLRGIAARIVWLCELFARIGEHQALPARSA